MLCEQGFITFSPQNPYTGLERFRTLQRKANPLGKCLFSIIAAQHQQITDWLKTPPFVDPDADWFLRHELWRQDGGATSRRW